MPSLMATSLRWRTHSARTNKDVTPWSVEIEDVHIFVNLVKLSWRENMSNE